MVGVEALVSALPWYIFIFSSLFRLPANRHIVATEDFKEDEIVFSIPRSSVLNVQTVGSIIANMTPEMVEDMPGWLVGSSSLLDSGLRRTLLTYLEVAYLGYDA
jgi:hypothetical protein